MSDQSPAIAILMPDVRLPLWPGQVSLDRLKWPFGRPERLAEGTLCDLGSQDHLIGFPQNLFLLVPRRKTRAHVSVLMAEPEALHASQYCRVVNDAKKYHRVLTYSEDLLARLPNGIFFPYGSTWVPDWREQDLTKRSLCSLIASKRRHLQGHALRHKIAEWCCAKGIDVDFMGRAYKPMRDKAEGLAPYRYSVVIENVRERNFFTEKLIDAVLCLTVPIYWGCPNIGDFMDKSGMITCETEEDLHDALSSMSEAGYTARLPGLRAARPDAEAYSDIFERAARAVLEDRPVP